MRHPFAFLRSWPFLVIVVGAAAVIWPKELWEWLNTLAQLPSLGNYMH